MTVLGSTVPYYGGKQVANPANVLAVSGAPSPNITAPNGTLAVDNAAATMYGAVSQVGGVVTWAVLGGSSSAVNSVTGTANQVTASPTSGAVVVSIPSTFIAPGSIASTTTLTGGTGITATTGNIAASAGNVSASGTVTGGTGVTATTGNVTATAGAVSAGTSMTATLGNITATNGNFVGSTAGKGLQFNANAASGAASGPVVLNSRAGQVTFTSVSIAAAADLTLTMTNSAITGASTQIIYSISGATTGSALSVKSVTPGSGTVDFVITNGTGATTTTADIVINFLIVN